MKKTLLILLSSISYQLLAAEPLEEAIETRVDAQQEAISTQESIDQLVDSTRDMVQDYEQATVQLGDLKVYNDQLAKLVEKQQVELDSFEQELRNAQETNRSIVPMMLNMLSVLEKFIELDTPFLIPERTMRLTALKAMMDEPDTAITEKFRRILEAYQIEADYGRTIEAYSGEISMGDEDNKLTVDYLRIGRVALYFTTLDGSEIGIWDKASSTWRALPASYKDAIDMGLRVARKQAPPDLIQLPLAHASSTELSGGVQ